MRNFFPIKVEVFQYLYLLPESEKATLVAKHAYSFEEFIANLAEEGELKLTFTEQTRKLLLHARELDKLIAGVQAKGFACVPLALYWKGHLVKCEIALVKGKKLFDKRATEKERDWNRQKQRILREANI